MIPSCKPLSRPCEHKKDSFPNVKSHCHNQGARNLRDTSLKLRDASHSRSISQKCWWRHQQEIQDKQEPNLHWHFLCVCWFPLPVQQWASLPVLVNDSILCKNSYILKPRDSWLLKITCSYGSCAEATVTLTKLPGCCLSICRHRAKTQQKPQNFLVSLRQESGSSINEYSLHQLEKKNN